MQLRMRKPKGVDKGLEPLLIGGEVDNARPAANQRKRKVSTAPLSPSDQGVRTS
jgi:hypothetical protein